MTGPNAIFKQYDMDRDGVITENEFVMSNKFFAHVNEETSRMAFRKFDKNGNGKFTSSDVSSFIEALGETTTRRK